MTSGPSVTPVQELAPLLRVVDIARSVDFYCEKLGFKMTANWEPGGKLTRLQCVNSACGRREVTASGSRGDDAVR